eukprot:jgi/Tetstr1/441441/TSEL_029687.t1
MYLLASLAACVSISVDGMTAVRNVWIKLGGQVAEHHRVAKVLELSLFRYEERLGKQRDYDHKSKLMEEPVRSAKTASHVETIEALKALAINRDFPTDMRSLSHRLLDTPV